MMKGNLLMTLSASYMPRRPNIISDMIDDEVVIINLASGAYYSLDRCGSVVWQALDAGFTVGQVIEQVKQGYEGQPEAMAQAVEQLVAQLADEGLMTARPANGASVGGLLPPAPAADRLPFVPPMLQRYDDMQDLILLDPIHEVDDSGWPARKPGSGAP